MLFQQLFGGEAFGADFALWTTVFVVVIVVFLQLVALVEGFAAAVALVLARDSFDGLFRVVGVVFLVLVVPERVVGAESQRAEVAL